MAIVREMPVWATRGNADRMNCIIAFALAQFIQVNDYTRRASSTAMPT